MAATFVERWHVELGLVGLATGGVVASGLVDRLSHQRWDLTALGTSAAVVVMVATGNAPWWLLVTSLGPPVVVASRRGTALHRLGSGFGVVAAMSLIGLWVTLPDTETALVAATVMSLALVVPRSAATGRTQRDGWIFLALAVVVTALGWGHRWVAVLGAICALSLPAIALVPRSRSPRTGRLIPSPWRSPMLPVLVHGAAIFVGSRVVAKAALLPASMVTVVVVVVVGWIYVAVVPVP